MATEASPTAAEQASVLQVLTVEYGVLLNALIAAWNASLSRSSIFLAVVSASGIALGFAAQGGVDRPGFTTLALVVLPLVAFLGITTFVRLVQVQREAAVYLTGMNRIRRFFVEYAPAAARYLVLPTHDDASAMARSIGTGMALRPARRALLPLLAQTQGIVGVVTGVINAAVVGLALGLLVPVGLLPWLGAVLAFGLTLVVLFGYWLRSLATLRARIDSRYPTPPEEIDARI
jgi:hypothetical protein